LRHKFPPIVPAGASKPARPRYLVWIVAIPKKTCRPCGPCGHVPESRLRL